MSTGTVLITGCSSGFGRLAAQTFQRRGWNVVATMRSPEREAELDKLPNVLVSALDVTKPESIEAAVEGAVSAFGGVDVLVNNAGAGGHALFEQMTDAATRHLFEVNVFGLMNMTRAVLPGMRKRGGGRIINLSSGGAILALPTVSIYCATKFAVEGFTEALSFELRRWNIRVMAVAPGAYKTGFERPEAASCMNLGEAELINYARLVDNHLQATNQPAEGTVAPNPQEVADIIYRCATEDMPMHNPVGSLLDGLLHYKKTLAPQQFHEEMARFILPVS